MGPAAVGACRSSESDVDAPSREVAEAAAASAFSLTEDQRKRLVVQERG